MNSYAKVLKKMNKNSSKIIMKLTQRERTIKMTKQEKKAIKQGIEIKETKKEEPKVVNILKF